MITVLHIIDTLDGDGAQNALLRLIKDGKERGIEYHVCCLQGRSDLSARMEAVAAVTHLGYHKFDPRAYWGIWRLIQRLQPDVIQTMLHKAGLFGGFLARFGNYPLVIAQRSSTLFITHAPIFPSDWLTHLYLRAFEFLVRSADQMTVMSELDREYYLKRGFQADHIKVIGNGIPLEEWTVSEAEYHHRRASFREELGLSPDDLLITQVGRLVKDKMPESLVKACAQLPPHVHFCFAGKGPVEDELNAQIEKLGLQNRAHLLGYRSDVQQILAGSDIFVLNSIAEAYPNVVLEAWTAQLPVISTATHGGRAIITDQQNGLLIEIGNADALRNALQKLIDEPALREQLGKSGYETLLANHQIEVMRQNFEDIYRGLSRK